ncbi:zinc finger CCCH domain-containing protein 13-like [Octopus sinensis]|uniref:Zinc finger CCCH domain-containing protein 13-like n=1 Tax=Octopus sinensis TaxID=2607531 RepID=A0A6P7TSS2_9MOLL|nr:zinc finger CCCH domain-containing protein 13-like [Octopus sinensis]
MLNSQKTPQKRSPSPAKKPVPQRPNLNWSDSDDSLFGKNRFKLPAKKQENNSRQNDESKIRRFPDYQYSRKSPPRRYSRQKQHTPNRHDNRRHIKERGGHHGYLREEERRLEREREALKREREKLERERAELAKRIYVSRREVHYEKRHPHVGSVKRGWTDWGNNRGDSSRQYSIRHSGDSFRLHSDRHYSRRY